MIFKEKNFSQQHSREETVERAVFRFPDGLEHRWDEELARRS